MNPKSTRFVLALEVEEPAGEAYVTSPSLGSCPRADSHKLPVMSAPEEAQTDSTPQVRAEGAQRRGEGSVCFGWGRCLGPGLHVCLTRRPDKGAAWKVLCGGTWPSAARWGGRTCWPFGPDLAERGPLSPFFSFLCSLMVTKNPRLFFFPLRIKIEPLNFCFDELLPGFYLENKAPQLQGGWGPGDKHLTDHGVAFQDSVATWRECRKAGLSWLCHSIVACLSFPTCQTGDQTLGSVH